MNYVFRVWHEVAFFLIATAVGVATEYMSHSNVTDLNVLGPILLVAGARGLAGAVITKFTTDTFVAK